jgi:hypothetical protein
MLSIHCRLDVEEEGKVFAANVDTLSGVDTTLLTIDSSIQ